MTTIVIDPRQNTASARASGALPSDAAGHEEIKKRHPGDRFVLFYEAVESRQAYFWSPDWQAGEQEAEEDIRLGRTRRFARLEDALAWLETDEAD